MQTPSRPCIVVLGTIVATAAAACGARTETERPAIVEERIAVRTAAVETRDLTETLTLTGTLDPRAHVPVVAEVPARLLRVLIREGDRVPRGAVLAVLDDTDLKLARDRAKAALDVAEANRAHARTEEERAAGLLKTGGITDKDGLAAQVAVQVAEASFAQARAELSIAEQQLARTQVRAPVAGRISHRAADVGTMLAAGTPIVDIVDDAVFEFRAAVPSADLSKLGVGKAVTVTIDALPGFTTTGRVDRVAPFVDSRSRSFEVVVRVPGRPELVGGLFARADIRVREVPGSLTVPPAALVRDGADPARAQAFVVTGGRVERRDVRVGVEQSDLVQVTTGLRPGEVVVVDPPASLGAGAPVDVHAGAKPVPEP